MKTKQLMAIALALGLTTWSVAAQDGPGNQQNPPGQGNEGPGGPPPDGGSGGQRRRPPPFMVAMDTNHDGTLSADEIANSATTLLTLDKKGDGTITMEEFLGPRPGRGHGGPNGNQTGGPTADQSPNGPPDGNGPGNQGKGRHRPPVPPIFAALDTNGDGVLSADEIANAPKNLLKLDKNGDGQLSPDELRPQRPPPPRDSDSNN